MLRATTACTFSTSQRPKVVRTPSVLCILIRNVLRATTACTFSTSQLPKVVRQWCVLYILTSKCASRHNGVQFFISHLASWLRTRRFLEPQIIGATNHWKNTVFRDFPTFSRICIFFLLTLSLLLFSLLIFLFSLPLPYSAFHLSILSEVWLLSFLRRYFAVNHIFQCNYKFPHGNRPVEPCELWRRGRMKTCYFPRCFLQQPLLPWLVVEQQAAQQRGVRDFSSFQGHLDWDTFGKTPFWKDMLMTSDDNEQVIQVVEDALFEDSLGHSNRANNNILNLFWAVPVWDGNSLQDVPIISRTLWLNRNGGWFQGFPSSAACTTASDIC